MIILSLTSLRPEGIRHARTLMPDIAVALARWRLAKTMNTIHIGTSGQHD